MFSDNTKILNQTRDFTAGTSDSLDHHSNHRFSKSPSKHSGPNSSLPRLHHHDSHEPGRGSTVPTTGHNNQCHIPAETVTSITTLDLNLVNSTGSNHYMNLDSDTSSHDNQRTKS